MILRKLSIFGFKSFAEKTELSFGGGMTAVIGPNGCGKSNVVDAIRWVFGEQRASMLRSANMQEVIFSGTQRRQPLNLAEVTLIIENNKGILPVEYGEVAITRRVYRNGESEYRLNKVPCRLKDIQNIFLDTGLGSSAYTTIENKMIEKILSDKAEERRILFEEAAGIGKYRQSRKETLSKLDKTRQDLLRICDKVTESERQVKNLARHVEKAKKYATNKDALKSIEIAFENRKYAALTEELRQRKAFLEEAGARYEVLRASIATAESRVDKMSLEAIDKERNLQIASRVVAEAGEKIVEIDKDVSIARVRLKSLGADIVRLDDEAAQLDRQVEEKTQTKMHIEMSLVEREAHHRESAERTAGAGGELARFEEQLAAKRREADQLGREQVELANQIGEAKSKHNASASALNGAFDGKARSEREIHNLESRFDELNDAVEACRTQLAHETDANSNLSQARETLLGRIEKENERYDELVEKEKYLAAQISSNQKLLSQLEGLNAAFEGYEAGVKALLTAKPAGLRGIAADLISVSDDGLLPLVEKLAGNVIQTVVFDTDAQLEAAVEFLRNEKAGSARMVSLESLNRFSGAGGQGRAAIQNILSSTSGLRDVRALINTDDGCSVLADRLFGNFAIADDYRTAAEAARQLGAGGAVISIAGNIICGGDGSVIAGESKNEAAGILQRKQQIEKLTVDIGQYEKDHHAVLTDKENCIITRDEAKYALVEVNEKINKSQRQQQEQQTTIRHYETEMQTITQRVQSLTPEMEAQAARIRGLQDNISTIDAEIATLNSRRDALDEQESAARAGVQAMEDEHKALAEKLKNVEIETFGLANTIANNKRDIERLTTEISQAGAVKQVKIEEKEMCRAEIAGLENGSADLDAELEAAKAKRTELEAERDLVREDYNGWMLLIDELRKEIKAMNSEHGDAGNKIHDAQLKRDHAEQERRYGRERMFEAYEIDLEGLEQEGLAEIDEDDEAVTREIAMYKERLKHIGMVNMAALDEFETESARLQEFTTHRDDLQGGVDKLEDAIKKLDKEAREKFIATFNEVQKHFMEMFTTLFEGGEASLTLQEGVDPLEAEINISVRPTGKKMGGIQRLSSGEKALTAISLLFALYLVKPSAYCILDELDAPLDDANISRFVNVLRKFAEKTQFIVITHNKRTMEAADLLYGVTQQELGVSTIVSVKFEEAGVRAA
ncbi:MAG: chromosome segregation protein SMC [Chitinispirillia bacterium]|nr:chromosome segregation protein SMC [Chitinispirillia bacterium]MCL2267618.1 chromosome segregation protein SMC [Chitinispirillia bacterium]